MRLSNKTKYSWIFPALAFILPVLGFLTVMIIRGFAPFGQSSLLYSDMYHQYYPFFLSFRRALLSGDSLLFNWEVGMGVNYLSLIAYYLASPLNLLCVFVPEAHLLSFFSLLVPIKLGFAGLFFAIFLKGLFRRSDLSISLFGSLYALCAWALGYQWNIMWLDTFALLPLVVLGAVSLLRHKKFILYTVTLFLSVLSNYYIGLFVCIFMVLLFIGYEICCWKGMRRFLLDLCRITVFSVLAIGMTAFLELPAFMALQTTHSSVNQFPNGFQMNIADSNTVAGLFDAMRQVAGNMYGGHAPNLSSHTALPNIYCGVIGILLALLFLTSRKIKLRERIYCTIVLLFLNISFIIRQLDYMWHGFHFTNMIPYRFSFLYSFVVLYMAYRAFLIRKNFHLWQVIVSGVLAIGLLLLAYDSATPTFWVYNGVLLALYFLILLYPATYCTCKKVISKEHLRKLCRGRRESRTISSILLLCAISMELILNLVVFGLDYSGVTIENYPLGTESSKLMIQYMQERDSDLFYRSEATHSQTLNDGPLNGYNGITAFTSSANASVTKFTQALGLASKSNYNRYAFEEGSPVANVFLNLKYMIERSGADKSNSYFQTVNQYKTTSILENTAYLPLGFLADPQILNVDFDTAYKEIESTHGNWNNLSFQNKLFRAATDVQKDPWTLVIGNRMTVSATNVSLQNTPQNGICEYRASSDVGGTVVYKYFANKPGFVCLDLYIGLYDSSYNAMNRYSVWKNGAELYNDTYSLPQVLGVTDVAPGDVIELHVECYAKEHGLITAHCGILDPDVFREGYNALNRATLKLTAFHNTQIQGNIDCHRSGILYTSIPQDGNWIATVDGKPAETIAVGNAMVGLILSEGSHTVEFTYHNKAFDLGVLISILSLLVFVALSWSYTAKSRWICHPKPIANTER